MSNLTTDASNTFIGYGIQSIIKSNRDEYKVLFISADSWNYTFQSMGSLGTILLLNYITSNTYDKSSVLLAYSFQFTSLMGIIYISNKYFDNYVTNFQRVSSQHKYSFGI